MCLPMMPAGPDSEVMKPIFTGSAARACTTSSAATRARTTAALSVRTGGLLGIGRRDSSTLTGDPGDRVDLDVDAGARGRGLHRRAGRLHTLEVVAEHAVEDVEVLHVAQEHAHLDDVLERGAGRLEHLPDVLERDARLLGQVGRDDLLGHGVERTLT